MSDDLESLRLVGSVGLDLSPGDPLAAWAYAEISRLTAELAEAKVENERLRELLNDYTQGAWMADEIDRALAEVDKTARRVKP